MIFSLRMIFRECKCKNVGVAGYAEAFSFVLSGNQTSEDVNYLFLDVLVHNIIFSSYIQEKNPISTLFIHALTQCRCLTISFYITTDNTKTYTESNLSIKNIKLNQVSLLNFCLIRLKKLNPESFTILASVIALTISIFSPVFIWAISLPSEIITASSSLNSLLFPI